MQHLSFGGLIFDTVAVGVHRAEKEMSDLEKMVDQKVQALHERLRGKEEEIQVQNSPKKCRAHFMLIASLFIFAVALVPTVHDRDYLIMFAGTT